MPAQTGYFDTLKSVAGKVFTYLASITLTGTDGKIITCTQNTDLDEAVPMSSKAPKASPTFTGTVTNPYTVLGAGSPVMKLKKLTGTTNGSEGGLVSIAHGLTLSKILSFSVIIQVSASRTIAFTNYIAEAGYQFDSLVDDANIHVVNHATNSENILTKPTVIIVMYEE